MSIIVRKLRLQHGWTQEDLARFAGLSVRSVQRVERGQPGSLETMKALAAVFETDVATLGNGGQPMSEAATLPEDEKEALEYVARIKGFYMHLFMFALFAIVFLGTFGFTFGLGAAYASLRVVARYLGGRLIQRLMPPTTGDLHLQLIAPGIFGVAFALNVGRVVGLELAGVATALSAVVLGTLLSDLTARLVASRGAAA